MIEKHQIIPLILETCPSFSEHFNQLDEDIKELYYCVGGDLARHFLDQYNKNDTSEFYKLGELIELFVVEGDQFTSEFAVIGILEGIQNIWGHSKTDPEIFTKYLLRQSLLYWKSLNKFWMKEIPYVGADIV
jgi:hypothetical protein